MYVNSTNVCDSVACLHTGKAKPHNRSGTGFHIVQAVIHASMTARHAPLIEMCLAVTLRMSLFHVVSAKLLCHVWLDEKSNCFLSVMFQLTGYQTVLLKYQYAVSQIHICVCFEYIAVYYLAALKLITTIIINWFSGIWNIIQLHQEMEQFGCGARGTPPPHIPLDGSRSTTIIDGVASVMILTLVSLKLMWSATSWDILEPLANLRHILMSKRIVNVLKWKWSFTQTADWAILCNMLQTRSCMGCHPSWYCFVCMCICHMEITISNLVHWSSLVWLITVFVSLRFWKIKQQ